MNFCKAKGEERGFRNPENFLTLHSKFPYDGGVRGVKKFRKLLYIIIERPIIGLEYSLTHSQGS